MTYFKKLSEADELEEDENLEIQCIILLIFSNITGNQYIGEVDLFKSLLLKHDTFGFKDNRIYFYCEAY